MKRATALLPIGHDRPISACPTITLAREERYRRRIAWQTDCGQPFLLDLPEATYLPDGASLLLDDGSIIVVRAAAEHLLEITAKDHHALTRIAWHIGNRHTPAELTRTAIYILPDHVLAEMTRGLGGNVEQVLRPFEPEGGAYGGHRTLERGHHHHSHHHGHGDDHNHDHHKDDNNHHHTHHSGHPHDH